MAIERGAPPYKVSSGEGKDIAGAEQFSPANTFDEALKLMLDLTNYGKTNWGQYITDSTGEIIISMTDSDHIKFLQSLDVG